EISESGFVYGEDDGPGPVTGPADPMYSHPSWLSGDFNTFATFGGGVGYKFGNGFRIDGTIEKRSNDEFTMSGSDRWDTHSYYTDCCGNNVYGTDSNNNGRLDSRTYLAVTDNTKVDGTLWLANMYYDLMHGHSFTPYVGAGIGFAWNQIGRTHTSTVSTCDMETFPACDTQHQVSSTTVTGSADKVTLAAAAMAGFSYDITDITTVDMGYRYLYIAGSDISMDVGGDLSTVSFGDQHVHQLRAGLRFNVN
ncbi:MAG: outer membrane protein, partial [Hyphomicrobium sp.]